MTESIVLTLYMHEKEDNEGHKAFFNKVISIKVKDLV